MGIIKRKLLFSAQNGQWIPMLALLLRGDEPTRSGLWSESICNGKRQKAPLPGLLLNCGGGEKVSVPHTMKEKANRPESAIQEW
jgi:hypothetical protein